MGTLSPPRPEPSTSSNIAFEIRFCEDNVVQVFDLTKHRHPSDTRRLPFEYDERDVVDGRIRYSKLGTPDIAGIDSLDGGATPLPERDTTKKKHQHKAEQQDQLETPIYRHRISTIERRRQQEQEREQRLVLEAQEAARKAMERKQKIKEAVDMARQRRMQNDMVTHNTVSETQDPPTPTPTSPLSSESAVNGQSVPNTCETSSHPLSNRDRSDDNPQTQPKTDHPLHPAYQDKMGYKHDSFIQPSTYRPPPLHNIRTPAPVALVPSRPTHIVTHQEPNMHPDSNVVAHHQQHPIKEKESDALQERDMETGCCCIIS